MALFISGPGQTYSVSVFVDPIINDTSWSRTLVSGMYTAGSLTAAALMVLVGRMLDRHGARVLMIVVGILFGFAALWMSQVDSPVELYAGFAAIRTLGQGALSLIGTTLVALWFVRFRGRAMALSSLGAVASRAVFPPLIHLFISRWQWQGAWTALAVIIWAVTPLALLAHRNPEAIGLRPDGAKAEPAGAKAASSARTMPEVNFSLSEAIRTPSFWLLLFASSSHSLISTALIFHMVSVITSKGLDAGLAATVLSVMAPMSLAGTFAAGYLADKLPNRFLLAASQGILTVNMLWTFTLSAPWQALVFGGMLGLGGGFSMTTNAVIWPNYYGRRHLGSIRGVVSTCMVGFAALGPLPFGLLFDLTESYETAILVFLAMPTACATAALLARPPQKQTASES